MDSLIRDCHKLSKHQSVSTQKALASVELAVGQLEAARSAWETGNGGMASIQLAKKQVDKAQSVVSEQLKELYANVSKYSKHVEKAFKLDLSYVTESRSFEDKSEVLAQSVLLHFLREGDFETARTFSREAGLELPRETQRQFEEMYRTVSAIRGPQHDLEAALEWATVRRSELEAKSIMLEFTLHRLRFLQLVERGQTTEALGYAREWFPRFSRQARMEQDSGPADSSSSMAEEEAEVCQASVLGSQLEEIKHLMGIFIYARRLDESPYAGLFGAQRWEDGARAFASAFCTLLGLSAVSPLGVTIDAGARALPVVCKVSELLRDKRTEWSQQNELPTEVPLPDSMRFHSVFACPVSKEQASPDNPPMMMPCGHVICKASLEKLAHGIRPGASATGRFKCPYCPGMSGFADAKRVYF